MRNGLYFCHGNVRLRMISGLVIKIGTFLLYKAIDDPEGINVFIATSTATIDIVAVSSK